MPNHRLTKLKITIKRLWGRCVYSCIYAKNKIKTFLTHQKRKHHTKNDPNLRKKSLLTVIICILGIYYGLGAIISSEINNRLDLHFSHKNTQSSHIINALSGVVKTQVDDTAWTPSLPIVFPAATLDNLPNFQLGTIESANFFLKKYARRWQDENLKTAGELLDYPPDIWLFSQTKEEKLTPGSATQYRKALTHIDTFLKNTPLKANNEDFLFFLKNTNTLLKKQITTLNKHIQEHASELFDFKADDIFYKTLGSAYTLHYLLNAAIKDYQTEILATEQYETITTALKYLTTAVELSPASIKNASPNNTYSANHLIYLGYYLSLTQNKLQEIYYQIKLKSMELPHEDNTPKN